MVGAGHRAFLGNDLAGEAGLMSNVIYTYRGRGTEAESVTLGMRGDLACLRVKGPPRIFQDESDHVVGRKEVVEPGAVVEVTMSLHAIAEFALALLKAPKSADMIGKIPYVIFFDTQRDLDEFHAAVLRVNPGIGT